jgi:hypothetical protein
MTELKFSFQKELYGVFLNGSINSTVFLKKVLLENDLHSEEQERLKETLLAYHTFEEEYPEIVTLEIEESQYDPAARRGKVGFKYILGYNNTCAGTRTDLVKRERVDFKVDESHLALSFLPPPVRSTAEEF